MYRYSARVFKVDGSSFPIAAFELESIRAVAKHAVSTTEHTHVVVSERVGRSNDWQEIFTVRREDVAS
jgi:hypothetical protein